MRYRTILAAGLLAASLMVWLAGPALAHSVLVRSNPTSGAQLAVAPAAVQMTFSEGVEPSFSSFAVIDRARRHYEAATPPTIDRVKGLVSVPLLPNLAPGAYIVQWKVVSVVDGHLTRGSFAFSVRGAAGGPGAVLTPGAATPAAGAPAAGPPPTAEAGAAADVFPAPTDANAAGQATNPGVLDVGVRWLAILLAACLVGGTVFNLLVVPSAVAGLPAGRAEMQARLEARFIYGALAATGLLVVTLGAELVLQAIRVTETDLAAVFAQPGVFSAVLASSVGVSLELRALAALAVGVGLVGARVTGRGGRWLWALLLLVGAAYFWAVTSSTHATALSLEPGAGVLQALAPVANFVHLLATAVWIGGIFYFVAVLLPLLRGLAPKSRAALLRAAIARFSQIALIAVPVLALSGTILYLAEQPSVASTLGTDYGRDVLAKVALLAVLLIPAAYNLRRVGPGLARLRDKLEPAFQRLAGGFRRAIRAEAVLVSLVLVFSALLTLLAPATDRSAYAGAPSTPAPAAPALVAAATVTAPVPTAQPAATATTAPPATLALTQTVRGVVMALVIVHGPVDDLNVTLHGPRGPITACAATPAAGADCALSVKLTLTQLEDNTSDTVAAPDAGGGRFGVPEGPYLALDGTWQVVVAVRRYNQPDDVKAAFRYAIAGNSLTGKISDYVNVAVTTNPDPPRSGPVDLTFHLSDNNGRPVTDATVQVQGIMPTHGHVTELKPMQNNAGAYTATLLMPMSGGWSVELIIVRPGSAPLAAEVALDLDKSTYDLTPYPSPNATPIAP